MSDWDFIAEAIRNATGRSFAISRPPRALGGGCINQTALLEADECRYFVKRNRPALLEMFRAEAAGLEEIAASGTLRVPRPICHGVTDNHSFLVLEYLELSGSGDPAGAGRQLAALHRTTRARFGWDRDNHIGSSPQPNLPADSWIDFWRNQRLGFQLQLAARNGHTGRLQERGALLLERFPALLDHRPVPSLLHGDLWGGNIAYDRTGQAVVFDPAIYYGDRETDLAMTELFGGFGRRFYAAYEESWPLEPGYETRKTLYNLYHILNHLNLFGGGYGGQALGMIDRLLAALNG
jgi:protein-ribulosamine 3-kinase